MSKLFAISRVDGRSDAEVLIDLVKDAKPDTLFTYETLGEVLSIGTDREFDREAIRNSVTRAMGRISRECQRALRNVAGVGYRLVTADEHRALSLNRKKRADKQISKGLLVLQHVRWDELSEAAKEAHQGQLLIMSGLLQAQRGLDQRMKRIEESIAKAMGKKSI